MTLRVQDTEDTLLLEEMLSDEKYEYLADFLQSVLDQLRNQLKYGGAGKMSPSQRETIEEHRYNQGDY